MEEVKYSKLFIQFVHKRRKQIEFKPLLKILPSLRFHRRFMDTHILKLRWRNHALLKGFLSPFKNFLRNILLLGLQLGINDTDIFLIGLFKLGNAVLNLLLNIFSLTREFIVELHIPLFSPFS